MFNLKKSFLDLLFPIECLGNCGKTQEWLCQKCFEKIGVNKDPVCHDFVPDLSGVIIASDYRQELLAKIIKSYKYNFVFDLSLNLSELLIRSLHNLKLSRNLYFDIIIPVPLSRKRKLWRGFNQAEIMASSLSKEFGWPISTSALLRRYHTRPQVGLSLSQRQTNIQGIFVTGDKSKLAGKVILLIDDVITSGSTMKECAKVLKAAGAKEIWGLVLARG